MLNIKQFFHRWRRRCLLEMVASDMLLHAQYISSSSLRIITQSSFAERAFDEANGKQCQCNNSFRPDRVFIPFGALSVGVFRICNYYSSCASRLAAFDSCILMTKRASLRNWRLCAQWRSRPVFMFIHDDDARNLNKQSSAKKIREKQLNDGSLNFWIWKLQLRTARGRQIIHPIKFFSPSLHLVIVGQLISAVAKGVWC